MGEPYKPGVAYVVMEGDYDDRAPVAVFTDRAIAEAWCKPWQGVQEFPYYQQLPETMTLYRIDAWVPCHKKVTKHLREITVELWHLDDYKASVQERLDAAGAIPRRPGEPALNPDYDSIHVWAEASTPEYCATLIKAQIKRARSYWKRIIGPSPE